MKILHVAPSFYPAVAWGGPITALYALCNALARRPGLDIRVLTTDAAGPRREQRVTAANFPEKYEGYDVYFCRRWYGNEVSPKLLGMLAPMVRWADVVHITATYSFPVIPALAACAAFRKPVVWSPRGALQVWESRRRHRTKALWNGICRALLHRGFIFHCTSAKEADETLAIFRKGRAAIIPNGVELPRETKQFSGNAASKPLRLMFLGLISPKKGLDRLVDTMALLERDRFQLDIYGGPAPGYDRYFEHLKAHWEGSPAAQCIHFHGFVDGAQKSAAFLNADVCVVPSHSENFCNFVAEALAHGLPVIASRGVPWARLEEVGCGYSIENTPSALADALRRLGSRQLAAMGQKGRDWMAREYSWDRKAAEMDREYTALL